MKLQITLSADVTEVRRAVYQIMEVIGCMKCGQGKGVEIELALTEALINAVVHGCKNDSSKQVQCCVACDEIRGMLIIVRDPGEGFDPASVPNPTIGENIFSDHGRGIFLINQLMDQVQFSHGGTEIRMIKH